MTSPAPAKTQAVLVVANPSGHKKRVPLDHFPFTIGRQTDNDVVIRDNRASRYHARIVREGDEYIVEDLKSRHGIFVNGQRALRHRLRNSDKIRLGVEDSYELTFTRDEGELARLLGQLPAPQKAPGTENLAKLRAVIEVARALQSSLTIEEVLAAVVDAALTVTGSERGFLLLRAGDDLDIRVARDQTGSPIPSDELRVPTRLIGRALKDRRELLSMSFDPNAETGVRPEGTVASLELRSVVCVPLVRVRTGDIQETVHGSMNETVGLIYLDSRLDPADLSSGNRELLQTLAIEASTVLENARLLDEERAKQRLEEELNIARTIQEYLLPKALPTEGWFRAAASSIPSRTVGGDHFDVIPVAEDRWSLVVSDVSGKGVSSALLAALLQGAFVRAADGAGDVRETFERMNRFLVERTEGEKYATMFYGMLSRDGTLIWSNAAHPEPMLVRAAGPIEILPSSGMPVGLLEMATFDVNTTQLQPGDKLVVCSDGFTEARNEEGEYFGGQRMKVIAGANPSAGCSQLHDLILQDLRAFTGSADQEDDITLLVVEYRP